MKKSTSGVLLLSLLLLGCAGQDADTTDAGHYYAPPPGHALVVFMRPFHRRSGETPAIYDITSGEPVAVGFVRWKTKIPHAAAPGKRRYMIFTKTASFMDAELAANKTYYVLVDTRSRSTKVDFLLRPVRGGKRTTEEFARWDAATSWAANTAATDDAPEYNKRIARRMQARYLDAWLFQSGKATLRRRDGH